MTDEERKELEFLRYFYENVEPALGPASDDIYWMIKNDYEGDLPKGYEIDG